MLQTSVHERSLQWLGDSWSMVVGGAFQPSRESYLLVDFAYQDDLWCFGEWLDELRDLEAFLGVLEARWRDDAPAERLWRPRELSLDAVLSFFSVHNCVQAGLSDEAASFWQAVTKLPRFRREFLRRMRAGHFQRVRSAAASCWLASSSLVPMGAGLPGLPELRDWRDLSKQGGKFERWRRDSKIWESFDGDQAWMDELTLLRKRPRSRERWRALYGRNSEGQTEFFGAISLNE